MRILLDSLVLSTIIDTSARSASISKNIVMRYRRILSGFVEKADRNFFFPETGYKSTRPMCPYMAWSLEKRGRDILPEGRNRHRNGFGQSYSSEGHQSRSSDCKGFEEEMAGMHFEWKHDHAWQPLRIQRSIRRLDFEGREMELGLIKKLCFESNGFWENITEYIRHILIHICVGMRYCITLNQGWWILKTWYLVMCFRRKLESALDWYNQLQFKS